MARTNPETRLTKTIRKNLMKEFPGSVFYKMHGSEYMESGIPDLIGCIEGKFVAIEVKHPDTSHDVTPIQQARMDRIHEAGAIVLVAEDSEEAIEVINRILHR